MIVYAALLTLAVGMPATAERFYVPVLGAPDAEGRTLPTEIWVANGAQEKTAVAARFVRGAAAKARTFDVEPGGRLLDRLAGAGEIGLIAVDAADERAVSAWMPSADGSSVAEVPVIGPRDKYQPGAEPGLDVARDYDQLFVGAANVSDRAASCHAILFDESNVEIARVPFEVPAKSLARHDAAGWLGAQQAAYAQVGCNRDFYPIGVTTSVAPDGGRTAIVAKGVGPNGTCQRFVTLTLLPSGVVGGVVPDNFHQATGANPKGIVCIRTPVELRIGRAVFEWDVAVGPWSKKPSGVHNAAYFFLERYRSGVIGNINLLGPGKDLAKWMQNVGMPKGMNTNAKSGFKAERVVYHMVWTFDAHNKTGTLLIQNSARQTLATITNRVAPGNNQTLVIKPYGNGNLAQLAMVAEFGNYVGQHHPEMASLGWTYANFAMSFTPK
jgi:hypothetical protein